jgi:hypothetical protein
MAKKTESSLGARIKAAEDLNTIVGTYSAFKPLNPEDAPAEVSKLITTLKTADKAEATALQNYSVATADRNKLVNKDADSLRKLVSPIRAYLQARYGKEDKQFIAINSILNQIAGIELTKDKKNPDEKSISTTQQSYASLTQAFSDLIATIGTLTPAYTPTNEAITLEKLTTKHQTIEEANNKVTTSFNTLTDARKLRNDLYTDLKARVQRIKKTVLSQYGITSAEYIKIKGFLV